MTMRQIEAQKEWCWLNNVQHEVRTEKNIRTGPFTIENRIKILKSITNQEKPHFLQDVAECIDYEKISLKLLCNKLMKLSVYDVFLACYWLYYQGRLKADIDSAILNLDMEVSKIEPNKDS
ncbi:hypothetical protein [Paenibacillus sp. DMB5]|uniref:hypothetical protein n=1 Tax=Paenibacillus sp. DMB5 TaxID=1780103 RepID=UPI00076D9530|nr:hypothetical protein [Paenibacillus sp. DMB5]KUP23755.1 hypothetical protein AWJ19_09930 [Paenibacillus sp. DMB5]